MMKIFCHTRMHDRRTHVITLLIGNTVGEIFILERRFPCYSMPFLCWIIVHLSYAYWERLTPNELPQGNAFDKIWDAYLSENLSYRRIELKNKFFILVLPSITNEYTLLQISLKDNIILKSCAPTSLWHADFVFPCRYHILRSAHFHTSSTNCKTQRCSWVLNLW